MEYVIPQLITEPLLQIFKRPTLAFSDVHQDGFEFGDCVFIRDGPEVVYSGFATEAKRLPCYERVG
jgi:hypothetical protein